MNAKSMAILGLGLLACQVTAKESRPPETPKEKASYAMGVAVAKNIQRQGVEIDRDVLVRGLRDALAGGKLLLGEEELRAALSGAAAEAKQRQLEAASARADRKAAGEAFRTENAKKEGVVTLASGVQYKVLKAGQGRTPGEADTVELHYRGATVDGRVVDSSYRRGKPVRITMARAFPGWKEVLKLMPAGSKWQVVVPPDVGFAARGRGKKGTVGRQETLVFELELLSVEARPPSPAGEKTAAILPGGQKTGDKTAPVAPEHGD